MSISTRISTALSPPITQANLVAALQQAYTNAGFPSPIQTFTSGTDQVMVYRFTLDPTSAYGSIILRVRVTAALAIAQQIFSSWDSTNRNGADGSPEVSYTTLVNSVVINFNSFNDGNETRQVILTQNATLIPLGLLFPEYRADDWDLKSYPYGFIWTSNSMNVLRSTSRNMYGNNDFNTYINDADLVGSRPSGNGNDVVRGIILKSQSKNGIPCQTSNNLGYGAVSGLPRFTSISLTGTNQVWIVVNNIAGGFLIQIQ